MVQVAIDEIIHVVAVWNHLVSTSGSMDMILAVSGTLVIRRASCWIRSGDFNHMFGNFAVRLLVMQVAIVKIVHVPVMLDGGMAALVAVLMVVILVGCRHRSSFSR
jgi:hypothetical protein